MWSRYILFLYFPAFKMLTYLICASLLNCHSLSLWVLRFSFYPLTVILEVFEERSEVKLHPFNLLCLLEVSVLSLCHSTCFGFWAHAFPRLPWPHSWCWFLILVMKAWSLQNSDLMLQPPSAGFHVNEPRVTQVHLGQTGTHYLTFPLKK